MNKIQNTTTIEQVVTSVSVLQVNLKFEVCTIGLYDHDSQPAFLLRREFDTLRRHSLFPLFGMKVY
jgi:hypothetical protein